MRHNMNRPVIVEGVFVLRLLAQLDIEPEVLLRAECESCLRPGSWPEAFAEYAANHTRSLSPDQRYVW